MGSSTVGVIKCLVSGGNDILYDIGTGVDAWDKIERRPSLHDASDVVTCRW